MGFAAGEDVEGVVRGEGGDAAAGAKLRLTGVEGTQSHADSDSTILVILARLCAVFVHVCSGDGFSTGVGRPLPRCRFHLFRVSAGNTFRRNTDKRTHTKKKRSCFSFRSLRSSNVCSEAQRCEKKKNGKATPGRMKRVAHQVNRIGSLSFSLCFVSVVVVAAEQKHSVVKEKKIKNKKE